MQEDQTHNKLWFRSKRYGLGWYPVTWQGWLSLLLYVAAMITQIYSVEPDKSNASIVIPYIFTQVFSLTALLIVLCYLKGEKLEWRWGNKK